MTRRSKKQQSDRPPLSGTRSSNERPNQRRPQRSGRREQERRKPKARLVVPSEVSNSAPPDSVASPARPIAEHPLADEGLSDVERAFFEQGLSSEPVAPDLVPTTSQPVVDDDDSLRLTPEQQQRRRWFRRRVTTLVAGMAAFGTVAAAVRLASLL
jgi:hypothetical protein